MAYGTLIPSLGSRKNSTYGFVNETQIRIGAGIMFTVGLFTFLSVYYAGTYSLALVIVGIFWFDFLLKVIQPEYSIIGHIAGQLSRNKEPQRVGAIQKRFARGIGLVLSSIVLIALLQRVLIDGNISHISGAMPRPMYICVICLAFMRLESILGWCAGCKIFGYLVDKKILQNSDNQTCPDGHCSL